jgi:8-oxo-dGTP pyrophosphatase MutT (NUDIX family)
MKFDFGIEYINHRLSKLELKNYSHPEFTPAAVLIPIIPLGKSYRILFTVRSSKLRNHRGEISFPGGKFDSELDKDLIATALRESEEEIGLSPERVKILGRLDESPTISSFIIRPFIGLVNLPEEFEQNPESFFHPNPAEVEEILTVPIDFLVDPKNYHETFFTEFGSKVAIINIPYTAPVNGKKYNIWGVTAHLLSRFVFDIYDLVVTSDKYQRPTMDQIAQGRKEYFANKNMKKNE